jgi:type IV pilus assembly protein PilO
LEKPKLNELKGLQAKLDKLNSDISETRRVANNLPKFKAEYEGLKKDLDNALTELPNSKEIPSLLTSITNAGKGAGLDFLVFRPKAETPKEFYAEVPVDISVSGPYFGIANFFVAVGNLPRIVNISNVSFADIKNDRGRNIVKVNCQATTFRFLDKNEIKDTKDDKKKK